MEKIITLHRISAKKSAENSNLGWVLPSKDEDTQVSVED
jgi:hypothetical protein